MDLKEQQKSIPRASVLSMLISKDTVPYALSMYPLLIAKMNDILFAIFKYLCQKSI